MFTQLPYCYSVPYYYLDYSHYRYFATTTTTAKPKAYSTALGADADEQTAGHLMSHHF